MRTLPRGLMADFCLLTVALAWGASYGATKIALRYEDVLVFLALRFALTGVGLVPFAGRALVARPGPHLAIGSGLGVLLFLIFILETYGVKNTSASNAALLISLCVLFTPLIDGIVTGRRPDRILIGLGLLYIAGASLLTGADGLRSGDLLILAAAVCRAVMVTVTKRWTAGRTNLSSAALTLVQLGTVATLTAALRLVLPGPAAWTIPFDGPFLAALLFLTTVCTGFAFFVQTHMVRATSPVRVAFLMGLEPLFGAGFGVLLMNDAVSPASVVGGALIFGAVLLGIRRDRARQGPVTSPAPSMAAAQ